MKPLEKTLSTNLFPNPAATAAKVPGMPLPVGLTSLTQILRHGGDVEITPTLAARILFETRCQYHLPPANRKVDFMADEIKAGVRFSRNHPLSFALLGGKLILINGWARLAAVSRSGIAVRFPIRVVPVDSKEQLRTLCVPGGQRPVTAPAPVSGPSPEGTPLTQILRHGHEVHITPELAERIEKECRYEHERPLKKWRVNLFTAEIDGGRFRQGRQISFAILNGKLIRMNGQHRLEAVVRTGKAQTFMIEIKPVANKDDLAALYATYDTEGRTITETAGPLLNKGDLGKDQLATLLRAVQYIYTGFRAPNDNQAATMRSHVARNQVAEDWYPHAERYFALTAEAPRQVKDALRRQSVAAVALYTLRYQPAKAVEFWKGLAMDDGLARRDPRKALMEKLRSGDGARSIPTQMHAVAAAWKAFFEGRKMKEIRVRLEKPFVIAGTKVVVERLDGEIGNAGIDSN